MALLLAIAPDPEIDRLYANAEIALDDDVGAKSLNPTDANAVNTLIRDCTLAVTDWSDIDHSTGFLIGAWARSRRSYSRVPCGVVFTGPVLSTLYQNPAIPQLTSVALAQKEAPNDRDIIGPLLATYRGAHPADPSAHILDAIQGRASRRYFDWLCRPNDCNGAWERFCDNGGRYENITAILEYFAPQTLEFMETYWKDNRGNDERFWAHEFNKHGTCVSTLDPECYDAYRPTQEVADYFTRAVGVFKTLPSYEWLAAAGIVPSTTATYTRAAIQDALKAAYNQTVVVNCNKGRELSELRYHYNVRGSVQTGNFVPVEPLGSPTNCPRTGIKYLPKRSGPDSAAPPSGRGYLNVFTKVNGLS
ncbi:hypothetical protein DL769_009049 [Monosporascus sp. CRB-8-3]|nr:hypothetical protein DL769_009049 [Monosporascus sp. CRB-8-3]